MPLLLKNRKKSTADGTLSANDSVGERAEENETSRFQPLVPTRKVRKSITSDPATTSGVQGQPKKNEYDKRVSSDGGNKDKEPSFKRVKTKAGTRVTNVVAADESDDSAEERIPRKVSKKKGNSAMALVERNDRGGKEDMSVPRQAYKNKEVRSSGSKCPDTGSNRSSPERFSSGSRAEDVPDEGDVAMGQENTDASQSMSVDTPEKEDHQLPVRARVPSTFNSTSTSVSTCVSGSGSPDGTSESVFDPNDPEWLKFTTAVIESPDNAHQKLALDLFNSTNTGSALLGKLLYRSVAEVDERNSESRKLGDKYCTTIIRAILQSTIQHDNGSSGLVDLVNMFYTELRHFRTPVLYNIVEHCLDYMKNDKEREGSLPPRWIEIFGKIIHVMITRGDIKHETDVLDGNSYREYIVREMCSKVKWTAENSASLIAIIREIPGIDDTELKVTIHHIKSILKAFKAASVPPIVYQLILLAGNRCPSELLALCAEYFGNDFSDTDKVSIRVKQKFNALGTVVLHFLEAARHCDALVKAVVKIVKTSFFDFGEVMSPCILSIVLGLTSHDYARTVIIDLLRGSVMKAFHSLYLSDISYWYRHRIGNSEDTVTKAFKPILEINSEHELECLADGIRELGIGLLNADLYQNKYPNTLDRCQKLGTYLITTLVKNCPEQLPFMMNALLKVSFRSTVHTECLAKCLEMRTRQLINPSIIGKTCEIVRHLPLMESTSAAMIVKALSSAFNLCYILLDQLMLILRKTIWKSVEARRTCAKIMIILLSNSRVVGDVPFSQYSESQRFYSDSQNNTQRSSINTSTLPDNQPLCLEILSLAKRCFSHQCEIRKEMYLGFHSVVRKNPGLCELVCMHLYNHASHYFSGNQDSSDEEVEPPSLLLGKMLEWPANTSISTFSTPSIKEELGFMIQSLGFVVHKSHQAFHSIDDGPPAAVERLQELLQMCIKTILKISPASIEIVASDETTGAGGGSRPVDSARYVQTVFAIQIMQMVEALIEYLNLEGNNQSRRVVKKLFEKHNELEQILKKEKEKVGNANKKGKGDKNKTKTKSSQKGGKDDVTIVDDAASETSENPGAGVKFKKPDVPKKLVYYHIITLESVLDMLRRLQKVDEDKGVLQTVDRNEFEKFLLSILKQKLENFKKKESLHERRRPVESVVETFADIAGSIWNGLLLAGSDGDSVDTVASELMELRLSMINDIVTMLCSSHSFICGHLIKVFCDDDTNDSYDDIFPKFFKSWLTVHGWMPTNAEEDKTIQQYLFDILQAFAKPLSPDANDQDRAGQVLTWIWNYMSESTGKGAKADFLLAESIMSCWLTYYMKGKDFLEQPGKRHRDVLTLAMGVKQILGVHGEADTQHIDDSNRVTMWIINEDTAPTILCALMNHIEMILEHITAVLAKLKSNQNDEMSIQNKIGLLRGSCFAKIDEIISVSSELVSSGFPACLCCTTMLKVVPQIFTVMTGFGEYFAEIIKAKQPYSLKGFAKPVSRIAKDFKPMVESMISHVERVQREYADDVIKKALSNKKNKSNGKVPQAIKNQLLKEKRLIPNFVYLIEKYDQQIIELSQKSGSKNKLLVGMKLSTAHDFKIDSKKFTEAIDTRVRSVQELTTVPDEESMEQLQNPTPQPGTSRKPRTAERRVKKARKRKSSENEEAGDDDE